MSSTDSTKGKSAFGKEDCAETSACMPDCSGCSPPENRDKMPKARKRKRSRGRHQSSSSQSSTERRGSRRTFIAISQKSPSPAQEIATVLARELRPEHKLPKKEIWVSPRPQFLKLLRSVGANGSTFTAKEVLSYLVKYISSRQLYDPKDPKNVYCNADPLGQVFNVHSFTIKDAKRLLFENMKVLDKAPETPTIPRVQSLPEPRRDCYITFRNNQEYSHQMAPSGPFPLPHGYSHPAQRPTFHPAGVVTTSGIDITDGIGKGASERQTLGAMLDTLSEGREGGTDEPDIGISVAASARIHPSTGENCHEGSQSESNPSIGVLQGNTPFTRRRKKHPKRRHKQQVMGRKARSRSESSSLTLASKASHKSSSKRSSSQRSSSKRSSMRSSKRSSKRSSRRSRGDMADGCSREERPWYCVFYNAAEDVKSQSSEIYSVQGKETAVVTDTSDDLWFMEEDRFSVEYEVEDSDSESESNHADSDSVTTEAEIFVEVDDLSSSSDSRFADEDTTDSEIPEEDKWKCSECNQVNNPVHGYCSFCWARRSGWLADEDRKNPTERLGEKHVLRRAFSAPAGCQIDTMHQANRTRRMPSPTEHTPFAGDEAGTGVPTVTQHRFYSQPEDFADGKTDGDTEQKPEERYVFCQISSPAASTSQRPLQGVHSQEARATITHLTTVHEASEDLLPAEPQRSMASEGFIPSDLQGYSAASRTMLQNQLTPRESTAQMFNNNQSLGSYSSATLADPVSHHSNNSNRDMPGCMSSTALLRSRALQVQDDQGVGSDSSNNTPGVADTVSHHSSESSGDAAGCAPRKKRKTLLVSREDSGVCLKRQSSGHSSREDQGPLFKGTLPTSSNILQAAPAIAPKACTHEKMMTAVASQAIPSGSSPSAVGAVSFHQSHKTPVMSAMAEAAPSIPHHQSRIVSPPMHHHHHHAHSPKTTSPPQGGDVAIANPSMSSGAQGSHAQELCRFCCVRPKTACIIHGRTGHQVCCYKCAKKLRRRGKPCPVCRRPIQHIVKNFFV